MRIIALIITTLSVVAPTTLVYAQHDDFRKNAFEILNNDPYVLLQQQADATLRYEQHVENLEQRWGHGAFNFIPLIESYSKSKYYDPDGQRAIDQLYRLAYKATQSKNISADQKLAITAQFQSLLRQNLGHLDIVTTAMSLVKVNKSLSHGSIMNTQFLKWVRNGLITRLIQSGTGDTVDLPYRIITPKEEAIVLKYRKVKPIGLEEINLPRQNIRIHLVEDIKTGKPWKIYTDVTAPISHEKRVKAINDPHPIFDKTR